MKIEINDKILENYKVDKLDIISDVNKHTTLKIILKIDKFNINLDEKVIKIDNIFVGIITEYKMIEYNYQGFYIDIVAHSFTKKLDINLKTRIYQDVEITYETIINEIMSKYDFKYICSKNLKQKIKRVYFQDNVTDYEFIKRILSNINEAIFVSYNGIIVFGIDFYGYNEIKEYKEKRITNRGLEYLLENKAIVQADNIDNLFVIKSHIYMTDFIMNTNLVLCGKKFNVKKIKSNVKGRFLEAKVVEILSENDIAKMKVSFLLDDFIDNSINKKCICFATPYSKLHTGFFVIPEIGDKVDVYFPSDDENDMKVAFCINNERSSIHINREYRNYLSKDYSLILDKGDINIISNNIKINSNNNFDMESKSSISIKSSENTTFYSGEINLYSTKSDISINSNNNLVLKGNKIHNN